MALNPQLLPNGMPVPFVNEMFVLDRDGVEFEIDKIPDSPNRGGQLRTKGTIYLSNIRMVFVAKAPVGGFVAFDMPLGLLYDTIVSMSNDPYSRRYLVGRVCGWIYIGLSVHHIHCITFTAGYWLYVNHEKFNQPIFHCNNISGQVEPVVPDDQHRALYSTYTFKILFKEGGCGTFVPLFFNLIASVRQSNQHANMQTQTRVDPLQAAQTPVDEMIRHAYVDPNDPTRIFLQQPNSDSQLRRRTYHPQPHGDQL